MRTLHLTITAGDRTCASEPGVFCACLLSTNFGTRWRCKIFDSPDPRERTGLKEVDGWIQRHPGCIAAESTIQERPERPPCPKCGKQPPDFSINAGPCCNTLCNGTWGTGCHHCHHPRFFDWSQSLPSCWVWSIVKQDGVVRWEAYMVGGEARVAPDGGTTGLFHHDNPFKLARLVRARNLIDPPRTSTCP